MKSNASLKWQLIKRKLRIIESMQRCNDTNENQKHWKQNSRRRGLKQNEKQNGKKKISLKWIRIKFEISWYYDINR